VSIGFITACHQRYQAARVDGRRLNYWGTQGYLNAQHKQELFDWLAQKDAWTMEEVVDHIEDTYNVIYRSQQSYYALLKQAGFSWKKAQPVHPDKDDRQVEEKKTKLWSCWSIATEKLPMGQGKRILICNV
jgi:transposase